MFEWNVLFVSLSKKRNSEIKAFLEKLLHEYCQKSTNYLHGKIWWALTIYHIMNLNCFGKRVLNKIINLTALPLLVSK